MLYTNAIYNDVHNVRKVYELAIVKTYSSSVGKTQKFYGKTHITGGRGAKRFRFCG